MSVSTAIAFVLALLSTTLTNLAYLRQHDAAAGLPALSVRRPLHSVGLLLADRRWLLAFAMESCGFLLYAAALALAPLALVQSIAAGGIGLLAYLSFRLTGTGLGRRRVIGVSVSVLGLLALAVSLAGGSEEGGSGSTAAVLAWIGATAVVAAVVLIAGRRLLGVAVASAVAGGLCFSVGDISTKLATQGGARSAFVLTLILGYALGTSLLQIGYQAGGALTVAGLATLLTNALPIAAGAVLLHEPVPSGALGVLRVVAFAAVTIGAVLLARSNERPAAQPAQTGEPAPAPAPQ
jgi:hypothetical protein